ncbi:Integrase core domain-containing protein, partial [Ignavigranum ruoffiae]
YQALLVEHQVFQSMSRKGNCYDNAPIENFFSVMKQEMYYGKIYRSYKELETAITDYIQYYNEERIKEKLNWLSPVAYRKAQAA